MYLDNYDSQIKGLFMKHEIKVWLEDIERSIIEIYEFLTEKRDFFQFEKDFN